VLIRSVCQTESDPAAVGWQAHLADDDEVVMFCRSARRGSSAVTSGLAGFVAPVEALGPRPHVF
jgi:hypothetical protein